MKRLRFEFETRLEFSKPVTEHCFTLRCTPFSDGRQTISEAKCEITPQTGEIWHSRDSFGNNLVLGRIDLPHDCFVFRVSGEAHILNSCDNRTAAAPFYRFPTPLTAAGEKLTEFYKKNQPQGIDILSRAMLLSESVHGAMEYTKGVTGTDTTAEQALKLGSGVCQDYAHILLALLRMDGIPCRYVSGLAFESGETHAWVEVHDGAFWHGIDPTQNKPADDRYIKLCHGRDYSDCPIERGIYIGAADSVQTVTSHTTEI